MKKLTAFVLVALLSSVCFAAPEQDIDFAKRAYDQAKANKIKSSSLCVKSAQEKVFSFKTENGELEVLENKINMGTYTLTLRVEEGKLVASVELHTREDIFPKHCLYFYLENIANAGLTLQNGQVDMQPKYYIKMDLMGQHSLDAFSTYTVGYAW